ncbi:MAG: sulfatase, partial [Anaerolineae bacterium]|nr:sulfatase [Anaerolineae bacterium]
SCLHALIGHPASSPVRTAVVHHSGDGMFSIRREEWKLILGLGSGGFSEPKRLDPEPGGPLGQLYDMRDDWRESGDQWTERSDVVAELTDLLESYRAQGYSRPGAAP